jgi:metal-responsive CopG/Arc/MetJ family transcriptional regulator
MPAVSIPVSMPSLLRARLDNYVKDHEEITRSGLIQKLIREFLDGQEKAI